MWAYLNVYSDFFVLCIYRWDVERLACDGWLLIMMGKMCMFQRQYGHSALSFAAFTGKAECVRLLLEIGARTEIKSYVRYIILQNMHWHV